MDGTADGDGSNNPLFQQQQNNGSGSGGGNGSNSGNANGRQGPSPQQVLSYLMRMDAEQRNQVIAKNPQLKAFLLQVEQQRRLHLQKIQQQQQQQQQHHLQQQQQQQQQQQTQQIQQTQQQAQQTQQAQQQSTENFQEQSNVTSPQQFHVSNPSDTNLNKGFTKDQIPNKPLQKKSMKKKALTDVHPQVSLINSLPDKTSNDITEETSPSSMDNNFIKNPNEWSEKLIKENKENEINTDLRMYENIINRDYSYLQHTQAIANSIKENPLRINDKIGINGKIFDRIFKDFKFYQQVKAARMHSTSLSSDLNHVTNNMWGDGYSGYGNGFTNGKIEFIFPEDAKMPYDKFEYLNKNENNSKEGDLIPIRLEFDIDRDGFKLNDTFLWNSNNDDKTLEIFVNELIKDYRIENNLININNKIIQSIKEQIADFHPMVINKNIDLRFPITLDITISNNQLIDKFDWDLMNENNDPEEFAEILCNEFSLPYEFKTAISHSIREQCQIYLKSLYMIGYKFDGSTLINDDLKEFLRSSVDQNNVILPRYLLSDFTPCLSELSVDNFEKIIKERERELRRKKRGVTRAGRRSGFILPDFHNMPKTFRTPLPNTTYPGAVSIIDDNNKADEFIDTPISVSIPIEQMKKLKECEFEYKQEMDQIQRDQVSFKKWAGQLREKRMRGAQLSASARVVNGVEGETLKMVLSFVLQ